MTSKVRFKELIADFPELARAEVTWEKEVYAHFGLTFSAFGSLEHGLANLLAVRLTDSEEEPTQSKFDRYLEDCFRQTLGNLIKRLESFYGEDETVQLLRAAKAKRDYLAHQFFREKAFEMFSTRGMKTLLLELAAIRTEVEELDALTERLADAHLDAMGHSVVDFRQQVQERSQELMRQALNRVFEASPIAGLDEH